MFPGARNSDFLKRNKQTRDQQEAGMRIEVIWNSQAGSAERAACLLDEISWLGGIRVHFPESSEEARRTAYNAALGDADMVVAAGGDGTVHDVLQGLVRAESSTVFAAIPLGTGNDFCRNAGIPLEPPAAFELLMTAKPKPLDLIRVSTDQESIYCVNMASGGNSGNFSDLLTSEMKKWWGPLVYLRGALDVIRHLQVFEVQLAFNDEPFSSFSAAECLCSERAGVRWRTDCGSRCRHG